MFLVTMKEVLEENPWDVRNTGDSLFIIGLFTTKLKAQDRIKEFKQCDDPDSSIYHEYRITRITPDSPLDSRETCEYPSARYWENQY